MTRVLPLPAPARMSKGPLTWVTASRWASVKSASRSRSAMNEFSVVQSWLSAGARGIRIVQRRTRFAKISRRGQYAGGAAVDESVQATKSQSQAEVVLMDTNDVLLSRNKRVLTW